MGFSDFEMTLTWMCLSEGLFLCLLGVLKTGGMLGMSLESVYVSSSFLVASGSESASMLMSL